MTTKAPIRKALILIGGKGTRLHPLTCTMPKPLVPFCNKPILEYQIEKLVEANVREIILALNYFDELIRAQCQKYEEKFGVKIIFSKEDVTLGTGGPLALARKHLENSSFFVMNSDICCNANLQTMSDVFMQSDAMGVIMSFEVDDPTRYGLIKTTNGEIDSFTEKPEKKEGCGPWIINAGMYAFTSEILDYIELREVSIEKEIFPRLAEERRLIVFQHRGFWMDIGQPRDYILGQKMLLESELAPRVSASKRQYQGRDASFMASRSFGALSEMGSARQNDIDNWLSVENNVVIGKNVRVSRNASLKNCTVFSGAVIGENCTIEDSIIGWGCVIEKNSVVRNYTVLGSGVVVKEGICVDSMKVNPFETVDLKYIGKGAGEAGVAII